MRRSGEYSPNNMDTLDEIWAQEKARVRNLDRKTEEICDEVSAAISSSTGEELAWDVPSAAERPSKAAKQPGKDRKKKRRRRRARRVIVTILIILLLLAAGLFVAGKFLIQPPDIIDDVHQGDDISANGEEGEQGYNDQLLGADRKKGVYTFLIVGVDKDSTNTDTILVGSLDTKNKKMNVVSIPRDTLVNVSWSIKKINSVYGATDGIDGLIEELEDIMGFRVDSYGIVDLEAFEKIVDTIGGVYYDVPVPMKYYDPAQDLDINIDPGYQWLSGKDALGVVRFRSGYSNGDIGRINTQQDFLMTVAKQMLSLENIPNLSALAQIYKDYVDTNLTTGNIVWYAKEFLKLDAEDITFQTMPGNYTDSINGLSYVTIYINDWIAMINSSLNPYLEDVAVEHLDILTRSEWGNLYATTGYIRGENNFYVAY